MRRTRNNWLWMFTLGMSRSFRKRCTGCGHYMSKHTGLAMPLGPVGAVPQFAPSGPPPSWIVDQADPRYLRWWDGQRFTEHVRPIGA